MNPLWVVAIAGFSAITFFSIVFLASRYRTCPPNKVLVIYGKTVHGRFAQCLHGGGTIVWPMIQDYAYLDLAPMRVTATLKESASADKDALCVPMYFTFAVNSDPKALMRAAERFLQLRPTELQQMVREIICGELRLKTRKTTLGEVDRDPEPFLEELRPAIDVELAKVGLILISAGLAEGPEDGGAVVVVGKKASAQAGGDETSMGEHIRKETRE